MDVALSQYCYSPHSDLTYHQVNDAVRRSAAAFASLGIVKGDHVAVFGENSAHWLFVDQGIQLAGGATVVRGADAPIEELKYIFNNSDAREVIGEVNIIYVIRLSVVDFMSIADINVYCHLQSYKDQLC